MLKATPTLGSLIPAVRMWEGGRRRRRGREARGAWIRYQAHASVVIFPVMFVGVQLLFIFLAARQEGHSGKNTAHVSSAITWPSCLALARWQLEGKKWVRSSCSQQGTRRREISIWLRPGQPHPLLPRELWLQCHKSHSLLYSSRNLLLGGPVCFLSPSYSI